MRWIALQIIFATHKMIVYNAQNLQAIYTNENKKLDKTLGISYNYIISITVPSGSLKNMMEGDHG